MTTRGSTLIYHSGLDAANGVSPRSRTHFPACDLSSLSAGDEDSLTARFGGTLFDQRDMQFL